MNTQRTDADNTRQAQIDELILVPLEDEDSEPETIEMDTTEIEAIVETLKNKEDLTLEIEQVRSLQRAGLIKSISIDRFNSLREKVARKSELEKTISELGSKKKPGRIEGAKAVIEILKKEATELFSSRGPFISPSEQKEIDKVTNQLEKLEAQRILLWTKLETVEQIEKSIEGFQDVKSVAVKLTDKAKIF